MKPKSPERLNLDKRIESFLFWALSILIMLLGLILTSTYFRSEVTQHEILAAIRFQIVCFVAAIFCCPATPIPFQLPFPSLYYRLSVVLIWAVAMEFLSYHLSN
jgi:hypothetical protein